MHDSNVFGRIEKVYKYIARPEVQISFRLDIFYIFHINAIHVKKRPKIVKIAAGFNRTTGSVLGKEFFCFKVCLIKYLFLRWGQKQ